MISTTVNEFVERYDQVILHPLTRAQYGGSGFYNVGDWSGSPSSADVACAALVERHIGAAHLDEAGLMIVDAGCGLGDTTAAIAAACRPDARIVGINISETQLAEARRRHPGLTFRAMDATRLEFADASVDRLIAVEAVFHFNPRTAFLQSARRVLRPGGWMVLTDVLFTPDSAPWDWWVPEINRGLAFDDYSALCTEAGFAVQELRDITAETWTPFCAYLRASGRNDSADRIEGWVAHYVLAVLQAA